MKENPTRRWKPLVFICSPDSGENGRYSRFAKDQGAIPLAPQLFLPLYMEETEQEEALFMSTVFLSKCEEVWVFGSRLTPGMAEEIRRGNLWKKKIRFFTEECEELTNERS